MAVVPSNNPAQRMSLVGQNAKYSSRADVFRFPPTADIRRDRSGS
jgi:hypothetical protein